MRHYGALLLSSSPQQTFAELLTLTETKAFLNLPERSPTDDAEDAMIEGFIIAAREQAEVMQNRDLVPKQYVLSLDYFPAEIELRTPLVSVDLLRYRDSDGAWTNLTENTDYIVDLARGLVMPPYNVSWPSFTAWPTSAVEIQFTSGYTYDDIFWSDAGQRILVGMKHLIAHWFTGRLPFEMGVLAASEYPFTVSALLMTGAVPRAR
jgi:uncharacterized phiE125 gp8 family phage protein